MIIIGIDPGTARLGFAIIHVDDSTKQKKGYKLYPRLIESSVIQTSKDLIMAKRLKIIHLALKKILKEHKPEIMVIERIFFSANVKTAIEVGQARGVALLAGALEKVDIQEYTALEAKKVLTGYGRSSKKEMQQAVLEAMGLSAIVKSDDANDAIAMVLCFLHKDYENYISQKRAQAP